MKYSYIQERLISLRDEKYRDFQSRLIPTVRGDRVIGVRVPMLRRLAVELHGSKYEKDFLTILPHFFYEENLLHAFFIEMIKDAEECLVAIDRFLPYVDNWAVTDSMSPKVLKKNRDKLLGYVQIWISRADTYSKRYGILMLMKHYLGEDFSAQFPMSVAALESDEYYVKMMQGWYFATALGKRFDDIFAYFEGGKMTPEVERIAVKKAIESRVIPADVKEKLKNFTR